MQLGVPAVDVLEDVLRRLEDEPVDDPELLAALSRRFAHASLQHLQPHAAEAVLERALEELSSTGVGDASRWRCRELRAEAWAQLGDPRCVPEARAVLQWRREDRTDPAAHAAAALRLVEALETFAADPWDEADAALNEAWARLTEPGAESLRARAHHARARRAMREGRLDVAESEFAGAGLCFGAAPDGGGVYGLLALLDAAHFLQMRGQGAPARERRDAALRRLQASYPGERGGGVREALIFDELTRRAREIDAEDPPSFDDPRVTLTFLLAELPPGTYELARLANAAGWLRLEQGRLEEAAAWLADSAKAGCRLMGEDCPYALRGRELRAMNAAAEGRQDEAARELDACIQLRIVRDDLDGDAGVDVLMVRARLHDAAGEEGAARSRMEEARELLDGRVPDRRRWFERWRVLAADLGR